MTADKSIHRQLPQNQPHGVEVRPECRLGWAPVPGGRGSRGGCRDGRGEHQLGTARARSRRTASLTRSAQGALVARWRRTCRPVRAGSWTAVAATVLAPTAWPEW